jgi:hypothetical protein
MGDILRRTVRALIQIFGRFHPNTTIGCALNTTETCSAAASAALGSSDAFDDRRAREKHQLCENVSVPRVLVPGLWAKKSPKPQEVGGAGLDFGV